MSWLTKSPVFWLQFQILCVFSNNVSHYHSPCPLHFFFHFASFPCADCGNSASGTKRHTMSSLCVSQIRTLQRRDSHGKSPRVSGPALNYYKCQANSGQAKCRIIIHLELAFHSQSPRPILHHFTRKIGEEQQKQASRIRQIAAVAGSGIFG